MKKLVIIGGLGNGTVVASTIEDLLGWKIMGFLNDFEKGSINGYPVLGRIDSETVQALLEDDVYFIWTLFSTKLNLKFLPRLLDLQIPSERFATVIHPTVVVSRTARIGHGVNIQPLVNIGPNVVLGNHIHIFAQAMIGHNAVLEDYSYVANNACVGAHVHLEEGAYLGTNCCLIENITIGKWALVGMGTVVLKDVLPYTKVVGNPARVIGKVSC